jgi:hypothetical protein
MLALTPWFLAAVLLGDGAVSSVAVASSRYTQQSLKDRCAIARIVAAEVVNELAFRRWGFPNENHLYLFISKQKIWDGKREVSIFGRDETCGDIEVGSRYDTERRLKVTLGRGTKDDLPSNQFFDLVRVQSATVKRWEITWKNDLTWTCPKPWEHRGHEPLFCVGPGRSAVPLPTLRLAMVKGTSGDFTVASSKLQFTGSNQSTPLLDRDDPLSDLSLKSRCKIAREIASGLAKSFAYSRWFGVVNKNITLAIPLPEESRSGQTQPAIFRPGERCDGIFANHWYVLGPSIAVGLASKVEETLPPSRDFFSVHSKKLATNRWEFSWTFDRSFWTCPKPDEDHYLGQCPDPAAPTIPMPTVRVEVVRESSDEIALVSSVLEFKADDGATSQAGSK